MIILNRNSSVWNYADLNGPDYDAQKDLRFRVLLIEKGILLAPVARKRGFICAAHAVEDIDKTLDAADDALIQLKRES